MLLDFIFDAPDLPNAACIDIGGEVFFPGRGRPDLAAQAKAICARCPERAACLDYALQHPQLGIWGGLNEKEREHKVTPPPPTVKTCRNGHPKTPDSTTPSGSCRACAQAAWRRHYHRTKEIA